MNEYFEHIPQGPKAGWRFVEDDLPSNVFLGDVTMTYVENKIWTQLEAMLPKSIDDIVRLHREEFCIRIATTDDLAPLLSDSMPIANPQGDIESWSLITLDAILQGQQNNAVFLIGQHTSRRCTWITSRVLKVIECGGVKSVLTNSGNLYNMSGTQSDKIDLTFLCAWLRQNGIGDYFGIPEFVW